MVRCDDFYLKWQKAGNFCEKHPRTAEQIDAYLNKILPLLEELAAESEILNDGSTAIAPELSETASRPLISEKDPEIRQKSMEQIVKKAEEKVMDGKKPQVTHREVAQIVAEVKGEPNPEGISEPDHANAQIPGGDQPDPVEAVKAWLDDLETKRDMPTIPRYMTDLLDLKSIKSMSEYLPCPCCSKPGQLVWKCCGSTIDEAISSAQQAADKRFEKANADFHARRETAQ
jgi:hypothetical protein